MSSIIDLQLDSNHDPVWDPGVELTDLDAVSQIINTSLLLFMGEWWENLSAGLPLFQSIIGGRNLQTIQLAITQVIMAVPFVGAVLNITSTLNSQTRAYSFTATVQTAFGTTTATVSTPGALAGSVN